MGEDNLSQMVLKQTEASILTSHHSQNYLEMDHRPKYICYYWKTSKRNIPHKLYNFVVGKDFLSEIESMSHKGKRKKNRHFGLQSKMKTFCSLEYTIKKYK